jgi:CAAX prenyl protease-like protein
MEETTPGEHGLGHGYWPYLLPMFSFLLLNEISIRTPERVEFSMLLLRVFVPLGLLVYFWLRGAYPELHFRLTLMTLIDIAIGIALAVLWIGPYVIFPSLRPPLDGSEFDAGMAGAALVPLVLSVRMLGYAIVTPFMEELFMRSFLIRYAEVFDDDRDFRDISIGTFSWRSFVTVVIVFLATHLMWEWWVMLPWAVLTTLWLYYRKDLFALVIVHAATNGAILLAAIFLSDVLPDGAGGVLPLWFLL